MSSLNRDYRIDILRKDGVEHSTYRRRKAQALPYYNRWTKQGCHVVIYSPEGPGGARRVILAGAAPIRRTRIGKALGDKLAALAKGA